MIMFKIKTLTRVSNTKFIQFMLKYAPIETFQYNTETIWQMPVSKLVFIGEAPILVDRRQEDRWTIVVGQESNDGVRETNGREINDSAWNSTSEQSIINHQQSAINNSPTS